jgi:hypothetical protein
MVTDERRALIPLLTIVRDGRTVRLAAWPKSILSHGIDYEPHPFLFVFDEWGKPTAWSRVEIHLEHGVLLPMPSREESFIEATVQLVAEPDHERILHRFEGVLTFEEGKVYFKPRPKTPTPSMPHAKTP